MTEVRWLFGIVFLVLVAGPGWAQTSGETVVSELECPDASALSGNIITDIYWDGVYPIMIAGARFGSGSAPAGAADGPVCVCLDPAGLPAPGFTLSMWEPAKIVELVRKPGCFPSLGGIELEGVDDLRRGENKGGVTNNAKKNFYHFHMYAYPILAMLGLLVEETCIGDSYLDFDLVAMSELDPTWLYDELAFLTAPEASLVSGLVAQSACIADAAAANADQAIDDLFWCVGSWGRLYPMVGNQEAPRSKPVTSSLLAARGLAAMHRRGLAHRTKGNDVVCKSKVDPYFTKTQYRFSTFFPVAEAEGYHDVGESSFSWGEWRNIPGTGEDYSYIVWRWKDCCIGF